MAKTLFRKVGTKKTFRRIELISMALNRWKKNKHGLRSSMRPVSIDKALYYLSKDGVKLEERDTTGKYSKYWTDAN